MNAMIPPRRHWRSDGAEPLPSGPYASRATAAARCAWSTRAMSRRGGIGGSATFWPVCVMTAAAGSRPRRSY